MDAGMYGAGTIARWFVAWADAEEADLSNLKLQKLLYYAQGHHLAAFGEPLFNEPIQAWSHGPVVKDVYHQYKGFGSGDVKLADDDFDWDEVDDDTTQLLIDVWDAYAGFSAWKLRNMTHSEPPWIDHFDDARHNVEIPVEAIRRHFASLG